jgi:hypothetical protein
LNSAFLPLNYLHIQKVFGLADSKTLVIAGIIGFGKTIENGIALHWMIFRTRRKFGRGRASKKNKARKE